jgi:hypothetical protein
MLTLIANLMSFGVLAGFIGYRYKKSHSLIEPGIVFALNLILLYPIRGIALLVFGDSALPDFPGSELPDNLEYASWLSVLGALGYVFGYQAILRNVRLTILEGPPRPFGSDAIAACKTYFFASLVGLAYKVATGDYVSYLMSEDRISGLTQIGNVLISLQWPALIGVWAIWFSGVRTQGFGTFFLVVNLVVVPFQFIQGSKTFLSLVLVSIFISYYWTRARIPKFFALFSIAVVILVVFPFVHSFREYINLKFGAIPSITRLDIREAIATELKDEGDDDDLPTKVAKVSARFSGIDQLYGMTQYVPDLLPYEYGYQYTAIGVNLIPRLVWPDKPIYSRGAAYGYSLGTITSVTPFPYGEAYWDAGIFGLVGMMAIWGACLALLNLLAERIFRKPALAFFIALYFLSRIYWNAGAESSMPSVLSGLPQEAFLLTVTYLAFRAIRSASIHGVPRDARA